MNEEAITVCKWALVSDHPINESAADRAALFASVPALQYVSYLSLFTEKTTKRNKSNTMRLI